MVKDDILSSWFKLSYDIEMVLIFGKPLANPNEETLMNVKLLSTVKPQRREY